MMKGLSLLFAVAVATVPGCYGKERAEQILAEDPSVVILFMFSGLCMGIIIQQVLSIYGEIIPYTVCLFILGILLSGFAETGESWGNSIYLWTQIDAEMILYIFLPPLIFGEAMNLNWYHVVGGIFQVSLLAGPGVIAGALLMGCLFHLVVPSFGWLLAFIFGSIMSATDPVAVVALLKSAGASPKLTILIVGESLMNDGTAIVLYTLFFNMLRGEVYTVGEVIQFFLKETVGSSLFGVVIGVGIVRWLRTCARALKEVDTISQIAITLCTAYLIYFIAANTLQMSGVLACCGAGLMIAWLSNAVILSHESMHNVWGVIEWMANTLIFLLAGLIIGFRILQTTHWYDWFFVLFFYVFLIVTRAVIVFLLYPLLSRVGHKCTVKEACFITWAGLRGALAVALALILEGAEDETGLTEDEGKRMLFYVCGIVTLTLVINGTFAKKVLGYLHLTGVDSFEEALIMGQIRKRIRQKIARYMDALRNEFHDIHLYQVRSKVTLLIVDEGSSRPSTASYVSPNSTHKNNKLLEGIHHCAVHGDRPTYPCNLCEFVANRDKRLSTNDGAMELSADFRGGPNPKSNPNPKHESKQGNDEDATSLGSHRGGGYVPPSSPGRKRSTSTDHYISTSTNIRRSLDDDADDDDDDHYHPRIVTPREKQGPYATVSSPMHAAFQQGADTLKGANVEADAPQVVNRFSESDMDGERNARQLSDIMRLRSRHFHASSDDEISSSDEVVSYIRTVFLEIVRVEYWRCIESGRLPRNSFSAKYLLYSIDVGLDYVKDMKKGFRDWDCIEQELSAMPWNIRILLLVEAITPNFFQIATKRLGHLEARREKRAVYMLMAFIDAHETAQKKIHSYLGDDEGFIALTPEESRVKAESAAVVDSAKDLLRVFSRTQIQHIRTMQYARMLLAREAETVRGMLKEGLLTQKRAELFFEEITADETNIEKDRELVYRQHAHSIALERQSLYRESVADGQSSLNAPGGYFGSMQSLQSQFAFGMPPPQSGATNNALSNQSMGDTSTGRSAGSMQHARRQSGQGSQLPLPETAKAGTAGTGGGGGADHASILTSVMTGASAESVSPEGSPMRKPLLSEEMRDPNRHT